MINFDCLMEKFLSLPYQNGIAVAVSGGADSMALTILLNQWCIARKVPLYAITIDHGLRENSSIEAFQTAQWLAKHHIKHHILQWHHGEVVGRVQEKARHARYQLLSHWCNQNKVKVLATGHHLLDQWETFMMRLRKGSGPKGLGAIRSQRKENQLFLIRPLLSVEPKEIKEYLTYYNQPYITDPSNENLKFERIRWRKNYDTFAKLGLDMQQISSTVEKIQLWQEYFDCQIQQYLPIFWNNNILDLAGFKTLHPVLAKEILQNILKNVGNNQYPCASDTISLLYQKLLSDNFKGSTAGNCLIKKISKGLVKIAPERRKK